MRRIEIYDTTLRDGSQGEGVNFSLQDKLLITQRLDSLGFDFIEGGYPLSNEKDSEYFQRVRELDLTARQVCAFGMTRRKGVKAEDDPGMQGPASTRGRTIITIVGKTWDFHVTEVLRATLEENLRDDRRHGRLSAPHGPRGDLRRRAFLRRLEGQPRLRPQHDSGRGRGRCRIGRAVRHQRRQPARGDRRADARRPRVADGAGRHPLPQRLRAGRGQFAGRGRRRRRRRCKERSTAWASAAATPI